MNEDYAIPPDFYNEEIRCGYNIKNNVKKIWAIQLDLLDHLLSVCKKYEIRIFVFAGTLLGAVRHKGFIPWDDDIDVCLLKDDYEKLLSVASQEFSWPYFFQTAFTDRRFHIGYARLRNSTTTGFIPYNDDINYNNGIFIDIFILNGYEENKIKLGIQMAQLHFVEKLIHSYYANIKLKSGIKKYIMWMTKYIVNHFVSYNCLIKKYYEIQCRYDNTADKVSLLTHDKNFMQKYWCNKGDLEEVAYMSFENIYVPVPVNYDNILKNMYGNYMEFPPLDKRGKWHENIIFFEPDLPYMKFMRRNYNNHDTTSHR